MNQSKLRKKIGAFPKSSGVYLMKNIAGRIIYIGKATNLRSRVASYFQTFLAIKTRSMMEDVANITYRPTESDLDALLLEARLVRELQPKYNMRLTDDKTFPLLAITKEEFPRVFITRERGKRDNVYFGPFISGTDLRNALRILQRIFRFRICKYKISPLDDSKKQYKPRNCLLSHIKLCSAPCLNKISQPDYREAINSLQDFLAGKKISLKKKLEDFMRKSSRNLDYEKAAVYRNQINSLENISHVGRLGSFYEEALISESPFEKLRIIRKVLGLSRVPLHIEGVDISDIKGNQSVGAVVVFIDGEPATHLYRRFKIKKAPEGLADDYIRIKEVVYRRFLRLAQDSDKVDLLLVDGGKGHLKVVSTLFESMQIKTPPVVGLAKGKGAEKVYLMQGAVITKFKMSDDLKLLDYIRDEAHNFAQRYHHLRRSHEIISLTTKPKNNFIKSEEI
jgi:excinuclease ABC subunit C